MADPPDSPRRVLIYRLGSLGDTLVALPALRLVARAFPAAERIVLTAEAPANGVSMADVLSGYGLVHRFVEYRAGERSPRALWRLVRAVQAVRADALIYLTEPRGALAVWRDVAFFQLCGISRMIGAPLRRDLRQLRRRPGGELWEPEAARLARCLAVLGDAHLERWESWAPILAPDDHAAAGRALEGWPGAGAFIAAAVGIRSPAKDWGEDKWAALIDGLAAAWPGLGLMLLGGPLDRGRIDRLAARAPMPVLARCGGDLGVNMALLSRARLLVATDGGPMHAAAGLEVPTVTLFSHTIRPGAWFPAGERHTVFWGRPLATIGAGEVLEACRRTMSDRLAASLGAWRPNVTIEVCSGECA